MSRLSQRAQSQPAISNRREALRTERLFFKRYCDWYSLGMEKTLTIEGMEFVQMPRVRVGGPTDPVEVYRGEGIFLRLGTAKSLQGHLDTHRKMQESGFPVANILKTGTIEDKIYFIEEGLGRSLMELFTEDCKSAGSITDDHFVILTDLTRRHLEAQFRSVQEARYTEAFATGIHLHIVCEELPEWSAAIKRRFDEAIANTAVYPFVLSHGDYNVANILEKGEIDLEDAMLAPIGFDPVSAIVTTEMYPLTGDYESLSRYQFSDSQRAAFYALCDSVFQSHGIPPLSARAHDFAFFRTVWLVARMHKWPKTQQYRYDLFIKRYLN